MKEYFLNDIAELLSAIAVITFMWWINLLCRHARMEDKKKLQFELTKSIVRNRVEDSKNKVVGE